MLWSEVSLKYEKRDDGGWRVHGAQGVLPPRPGRYKIYGYIRNDCSLYWRVVFNGHELPQSFDSMKLAEKFLRSLWAMHVNQRVAAGKSHPGELQIDEHRYQRWPAADQPRDRRRQMP